MKKKRSFGEKVARCVWENGPTLLGSATKIYFHASTIFLVIALVGLVGGTAPVTGAIAFMGCWSSLAAFAAAGTGSLYCEKKRLEMVFNDSKRPSYKPCAKPLRVQPLGPKFGAVALNVEEAAAIHERTVTRTTALQRQIKVGRPLTLKNNRMEKV